MLGRGAPAVKPKSRHPLALLGDTGVFTSAPDRCTMGAVTPARAMRRRPRPARTPWPRPTLASAADVTPLVVAALLFVVAAWLLGRTVAALADSDALYLAGLYRDLFLDQLSIAGWNTQPAPSFFPDLPVYFALRATTGNPVVALVAYAVTELGLGVAFVVALVRVLEASPRRVKTRTALAAGLAGMALLAYVNSFRDYLYVLFFPSCHGSAVWVSVASAWLIARQISLGAFERRLAAIVFVLTALTAASDQIYLLHAAALVVALVLCALPLPASRGLLVRNALAIGLGVGLARFLEQAPGWLGMRVASSDLDLEFTTKRVVRVLRLLAPPQGQLLSLVLDVSMLGVSLAAAAIVVATAVAKRDRDEVAGVRVFLSVAFVVSAGFLFFGSAWSGLYVNARCARYLQTLLVVPYLVVPVAFVLAPTRLVRVSIVTWLGAVAAFTGWPTRSEKLAAALADDPLYPAKVACIDDVARRNVTALMYSGYWDARRTTELSRAGVHALAVTPGARTYEWIANRQWYDLAAREPRFLFLLRHDAGPAARFQLGDPGAVAYCGEDEVWSYTRRTK